MTREQLKSFCGSHWKWEIDRPFAKDGRLWATDAKIAISVLTDEPDDVPKDGKFPPVGEVMKNFRAKVSEEITLPAVLPESEYEKCDECDGEGVKPAKTGDACFDCGGTGKQEKITAVVVGKQTFDAKYLRLIMGLAGLKCREAGPTMLFTADGGVEGLIMSLNW